MEGQAREKYPAEEALDGLKDALRKNRNAVLVAPPGSGKTTCIPPALLGEPWLEGRKIVMLEPRRLAAKNSARRIASMLGESPGGTVGYSVRLESRKGPSTRLEIVTEGLLAQRLLADPELADTGLLVFDEFHERSLDCDLAMALALETKRAFRPDLRILAMSATLDAEETAASLDNAAVVRAGGRMFDVETVYLGDMPTAGAVARALRETDGDILCFLPGEAEIKRTAETLLSRPCDALVLPLYGSLPPEEQDRVFAPADRRKIILSTSIAESSLTVPGISCVIDCGLMRTSRFSPATGMSALATLPLPLDRAEQRRGRAGRLRPGVCYRLWEERENAFRPAKTSPEIMDADLAGLVLASASWGAVRRTDLPWITPPPDAAWEQASSLLRLLGATGDDGRPTPKGERMSRLPMHPRLAAMFLAGGGRKAALLAAILEECRGTRETDIGKILDSVVASPRIPLHARILKLASRFQSASGNTSGDAESEGALLAAAFPDRVAANRGNGSFRMVCGKGAALDANDPLSKSRFLVCCRLDGRQGDAKIFLAAPISKDEIESIFSGSIREEKRCFWDRREERVRAETVRVLGEMDVETKPLPAAEMRNAPDVLEKLAEGMLRKGTENLPCWTKAAKALKSRIDFMRRRDDPSSGRRWPETEGPALVEAIKGFAYGMTKWSDLESIDLVRVLESMLASCGCDRRTLDALAPERMEVPSGSMIAVDYSGDEPTVAARLQECFGMQKTPAVAGGRIPVAMTLLSPAMRQVQITKDLAGFWREGYAIVRKDMRGRYPKHYWPEDPATAVATRRTRPKTEEGKNR